LTYEVWVHPEASVALSALPTALWLRVVEQLQVLAADPFGPPSVLFHPGGPEAERAVALPEVVVAFYVDEKTSTVVVRDVVWSGTQ
jgi:mRNA-degrading endonuclease RelE of RelBE toxin-antitoxin system